MCPCVCQYHTCGRRSARVPRVLPSSELSGPGLLRVGHSAGPHPTPIPTIPSQGLGRRHPQKPGQNQKYICKKAGILLNELFFSGRS